MQTEGKRIVCLGKFAWRGDLGKDMWYYYYLYKTGPRRCCQLNPGSFQAALTLSKVLVILLGKVVWPGTLIACNYRPEYSCTFFYNSSFLRNPIFYIFSLY